MAAVDPTALFQLTEDFLAHLHLLNTALSWIKPLLAKTVLDNSRLSPGSRLEPRALVRRE